MLYRLDQRIHTLALNVIDNATVGVTGFPAEGVEFLSWRNDPNDPSEGYWTHKYWLATAEIEADRYTQAWNIFWGTGETCA